MELPFEDDETIHLPMIEGAGRNVNAGYKMYLRGLRSTLPHVLTHIFPLVGGPIKGREIFGGDDWRGVRLLAYAVMSIAAQSALGGIHYMVPYVKS